MRFIAIGVDWIVLQVSMFDHLSECLRAVLHRIIDIAIAYCKRQVLSEMSRAKYKDPQVSQMNMYANFHQLFIKL